jgi:hypothetical protein
VREDVLDGFATRAQARDVYGVVLDDDTLELDLPATAALREALAAAAHGAEPARVSPTRS